MNVNVGTTDSRVRLVIGVVLVELAAIGFLGPWAYIGILPLVTGMFRKCPIYRVFHWTTAAPS